MELEQWDISTLHKLTKLRDIERETFDFKGTDKGTDFTELYKHICAFANFPINGIIVLGIEEEKSTSGFLIQFSKKGFDLNKEDWVRNEINNQMANVEPTPKLDINCMTIIKCILY
jgi:predicted HTH transcriptional regulator